VEVEPVIGERRVGRIPVRNLWLLMLYASELARISGEFRTLLEADGDDLPDLVAQLLAMRVEFRLKRNLTRGYRNRQAVLTRVRGRIDLLATETRQLLDRGEVFCRFQELTVDTPRNRLIRAALDRLARLVANGDLAHRCRALASSLARAGVGGLRPSRSDMALEQFGRNDAADRSMVALALLAFDLALPTEVSGPASLFAPDKEEAWVRRLFEKAVLGFARVELEPLGWTVQGGVQLHWQVSSKSDGIAAILPRMVTDIILEAPTGGRRLIVDTKFTSIFGVGRFGGTGLKSNYIYQIYAYLRSQECLGQIGERTDGLLLHPAIDADVHENVVIQGHSITFATVNLSKTTASVRAELLGLFLEWISTSASGRSPQKLPQ
jgi:5-methylcytosine-specific restriction enzyme subunit McrC